MATVALPNNRLTRRGFFAAAIATVAAACSDDATSRGQPTSTSAVPSSSTATADSAAASSDTSEVASSTTTSEPRPPVPDLEDDPFTLGVASGDPLPDAVVIWTRLAPDPTNGGGMPRAKVPVTWEVATDEAMRDIAACGDHIATPAHAHSVHVDVTGLDADTTYWFRFSIGDHLSPVGRTRTAPAPDAHTDSLRFAVANCAAWKSGLFTAYEHLANEDDLDAVFFTGDYIYELESGSFREHDLPAPFTVDEYRAYYTVARLEPALQNAHARHPWIVTWDDHEVEDNYAGWEPGGIGVTLGGDRESFRARRIAAYQAWWEHMPVRAAAPVEGELIIYRDFEFGDLAKVSVLDDRQYRSPIVQGEGDGNLPRPLGGGPQLEETFDTSRTMLGSDQETWLEDSLVHDRTWTLLVQQTLMAQVDRAPDDPDKGFSMDAWDGYAAPREDLLGFVHEQGIENFVVLGGDIHTSAVADLHVSYRDPDSPMVGSEFIAPSVTSLELLLPEFVEGSRSNPHIRLYDTDDRGYLLVDVTPQQVDAHFRLVDALTPGADVHTGSSWRVTSGTVGVEQR